MRNMSRGALAALSILSFFLLHFAPAQAADEGVQPVPGGWVSVSSRDDAVIKAARFALVQQARQSSSELILLAIKHVRLQVVSGSNFSMNLMVMSEGKRRLAIAVVWSKLDGSLELTRWHWV
jgi:hypothetical protein